MVERGRWNSRLVIVGIFTVLTLLLAACAPEQPAAPAETAPTAEAPAQETPEEGAPAEQPTATPTPEEAAAPAAAETFQFEGLNTAAFESYVADVRFEFEGTDAAGEPVTVDQVFTLQAQRDPTRLAFNFETLNFENADLAGLPINPQDLEALSLYVTQDRLAVDIGGLCFALPVQQGDVDVQDAFGSLLLDPNDLADPGEQLPELTLVGRETIDGQETLHYEAEGVNLQNLENATIDVWWLPDAQYITRMEVTGMTTAEDFTLGGAEEGQLHFVYDVTSVNEPLDVTVPENCQEFTLPEAPQS